MQQPALHARYRVLGRIGHGAAGVVYRVEDADLGRVFAVKVMPRDHGRSQLSSEFAALARLRHPNIVSVHDYGITSDGHDYYTMDLVEGPPLTEIVRRQPELTYELAGGVLRALALVHGRGMVHADIKPQNVLCDAALLAEAPARAARLADFGLASTGAELAASDRPRGSFPYAAPEAYSGRLDARSDLYSFGVLFYQLLSGTLPFGGDSIAEVLAAQQSGAPPDVRERRADIPAAVAELCAALLDPAPGARPQSADEVLARLGELAGSAADGVTPARVAPSIDVGATLIGRQRDLAALEQRWNAASVGQGSTVLVVGEEGVGKSRLLAELRLRVQLAGGRTYSTALAIPEPFASRGSAAPTETGSRFARAEQIAAAIQEQARDAPLLITIEEMQEAGADLSETVSFLARALVGAPVLFCLAVRDADGGPPGSAARLSLPADALELRLPPLDRAAVRELLALSISPAIAEELAGELHRASGGNPGFITGAVHEMLLCGAIAREAGEWVLADERGTVPTPENALVAARRRLEQLSVSGRELAGAAAVFGDEFECEALAAALERDPVEIADELAEVVAARLLAVDATAGRYRFVHRELGRVLYSQLAAPRRRELHERAAARLERLATAGSAVPPESAAVHYVAIGDSERGVPWAVRAAEARARDHEPHHAIHWFRHAVALAQPGAEETAELQIRVAELHALVGDAARAVELYQLAREALGARPAERARLGRRIAEMRHRLGDGTAALALLMSCLEDARRHRLVREEIECHLAIGQALYYAADYKLGLEHAVAGALLARAGDDRRLAAELGRLRGSLETSAGDTKTALLNLDQALVDARATGDEVLIARVESEVGRTAIHAGDYQRAIEALERAIAVFRRVCWLEREAGALNNLGGACYFRGDWERARASWDRFCRLCERLEWRAELVTALNNLGLLYRDLGRLEQALDTLNRAGEVARSVQHDRMAATVLGNRGEVLFRRGELADAGDCYRRALVEFERIGALEEVVECKRRLCELAIATANYQDALDRAIDVLRDAKDSGARLEEGILHRVAATAERLRGDMESAAWFCERAREIFSELGARYELARLDVERGQLAAATGNAEQAARHLEAAVEVFTALGARWDLTRARAQLRSLRPRLAEVDTSAAGGGGQLRLLLELASIAATLEIDKVLEHTLDGALALTGFERGFVLLLDEDGRPRERTRRLRPGSPAFARDEAQLSGSIVRRVATSRQALAITDADREEELREHKSVLSLGLRQVLCAPMMSRDQVIGIVYMDSRYLSAKDHRVDLPVLEAFAALAAQGVENSRLREESRRKSELMAILAHEIRNPLSGILGYSDIGEQEERERGGEAARLFERIRRDGERLRRLVDNVLELARNEAQVEWSFFTFHVSDAVNDAVASFRPACDKQKIRLEVETTGADLSIFGNPDRLTQVLVNLIGNAVKFTPEGGRIQVTARRETARADDPHLPPALTTGVEAWAPLEPAADKLSFLRIDVADTGPGMSNEIRNRLFEKFSQGEMGRSKGVGLGLYISREIVRRHGGVIWVESELGNGSTFSVRIPLPF